MKRKYTPFGEFLVKSTKTTYNWARGPGARLAVRGGRLVGNQAKSAATWVKNQSQGGPIGKAKYGGMRERVFGKKKLFED